MTTSDEKQESQKPEPAAGGSAPDRLGEVLLARRDAELQRQHRRVGMADRLTSVWSPIVIFLLCFAPYVVLVELWPSSAAVAQPALKAIGLVLVLWFFGAIGYRLARKQFAELRKARIGAEELLVQLERELRRRGVDPSTREKLLDLAEQVDRSRAGQDKAKLDSDVDRLGAGADKLLKGWRTRSTVAGARGLALTLLGVVLLRTVVVEPFKIPSGSMIPTLEIGDHVVVNRFIYGVRIPWMNKVPFVIVRRPKRGDVIVFNNPRNESVDFIKRVIGVPGDTVALVDEQLVLNGQAVPRELVEEDRVVDSLDELTGRWYQQSADRYLEKMEERTYSILQGPDRKYRNLTQGPWTVPEGHVFVLGDNRDNSSDSRFGFAVEPQQISFVPYGHIKGKAMVVWLALGYEGLGSSLPFWPFDGSGLRTDRMFQPVR